jgi:hypothetical protein
VKESLNVSEGGGVKISEVAVEIVSVGPIAEGDRREIQPRKATVRLIHYVYADFFLDHIALVAQILVVYLQGAHAIRFEPEHSFECVGRDGFEIIGDVVIGGAIQHAAGRIDEADVFHFAGVFRTLKHHVLEKMGETASSAWFKAKTNLIVNADRDDGRGTVWRYDHTQAICQRGVFDGNVQILHF